MFGIWDEFARRKRDNDVLDGLLSDSYVPRRFFNFQPSYRLDFPGLFCWIHGYYVEFGFTVVFMDRTYRCYNLINFNRLRPAYLFRRRSLITIRTNPMYYAPPPKLFHIIGEWVQVHLSI